MIEITVTVPSFVEAECMRIAETLGVSLDMLAAYFFARGWFTPARTGAGGQNAGG